MLNRLLVLMASDLAQPQLRGQRLKMEQSCGTNSPSWWQLHRLLALSRHEHGAACEARDQPVEVVREVADGRLN